MGAGTKIISGGKPAKMTKPATGAKPATVKTNIVKK